jgi:hypothetical protein
MPLMPLLIPLHPFPCCHTAHYPNRGGNINRVDCHLLFSGHIAHTAACLPCLIELASSTRIVQCPKELEFTHDHLVPRSFPVTQHAQLDLEFVDHLYFKAGVNVLWCVIR